MDNIYHDLTVEIPPSLLDRNIKKEIDKLFKAKYLNKCIGVHYIKKIEPVTDLILPLLNTRNMVLTLNLSCDIYITNINDTVNAIIYHHNDNIYGETEYVKAKILTDGMVIGIMNDNISIKYNNKTHYINNKTEFPIKIDKLLNSDGQSKINVLGSFVFNDSE